MRFPTSTKEVLRILHSTGVDAPILPQEDSRWQRLQLMVGHGVDLHDRYRGALVVVAIGEKSGSTGREFEGSAVQGSKAGRAVEAGMADIWDHLADPDDLARRFAREHIRGICQATREFVRKYEEFEKLWYGPRGDGCLGARSALSGTIAGYSRPAGLHPPARDNLDPNLGFTPASLVSLDMRSPRTCRGWKG